MLKHWDTGSSVHGSALLLSAASVTKPRSMQVPAWHGESDTVTDTAAGRGALAEWTHLLVCH